jgi:hypothetical protein
VSGQIGRYFDRTIVTGYDVIFRVQINSGYLEDIPLYSRYIAFDDTILYSFVIENLPLRAGDRIYFLVNAAGWNANNSWMKMVVQVESPSGVSPQMIQFIINHPGSLIDPDNCGELLIDPYFDPEWSQTFYTFNFETGRTTYLDTPVIPVAAFVGYPNRTLDVEPPAGTPVIKTVNGPDGGPIVCNDEDKITIEAVGMKWVDNPDYDPDVIGSDPLIQRDFGFGPDTGEVTVGGVPLNITGWNSLTITATVDFDTVNTGQLVVIRGDNDMATELGVTLHVDACANAIHVEPNCYPATPIQDAIDAANPGDLIIIEPGNYFENPIVWKPVILQGSGTEGTVINANPIPSERVTTWTNKMQALANDENIPAGVNVAAIQGPGIMVVANPGVFNAETAAVIDGLTITGAVAGGGIYVYTGADYLQIRNNNIRTNQGTEGGAINIGEPGNPTLSNTHIRIHNNYVIKNGGIDGAGGINIGDGSANYEITNNLIMGNFTRFSGGGISHNGLSDGGVIAHNSIINNEVFYGGQIGGDGGGIYVAGLLDPEDPGEMSDGSGNVTINGNLIQGNLAGSAHGGGIAAFRINGSEVLDLEPANWNKLNIFNNIVVNNVSAASGGGIYSQDAVNINVVNNTIANNESAGTSALAFSPGNLLLSNPQPAGVVSAANSQLLSDPTGVAFPNLVLQDNILVNNRSWRWDASLNGGSGGLTPHLLQPIWDLAVVDTPNTQYLNPNYCLLSSFTDAYGADYDDGTNLTGDPGFNNAYQNTLAAAAVIDEGGNFITTRFLPIGRQGDYHISPLSAARDMGGGQKLADYPELALDFDIQTRPAGVWVDCGADEMAAGLLADLNGDGTVDIADFVIFVQNWGGRCDPGVYCIGDFNGDGRVNMLDWSVFVAQFGQVWWP